MNDLTRRAVPLILLGLLLQAGCEINQPEIPSFDTAFVLPLGTERLLVMDAVDSEDFLQVGADGSLGFLIEGEADTLGLSFDLSVAVPDQNLDQGLGDFALPALAPLSWSFELGTVWAPANAMDGQTVAVPAFPISLDSGAQDLPDLQSATLSAGTLTLTLVNHLPVPISADSGPEQIMISLASAADGAVVTTLVLPLIRPGQTHTGTADLAGAVLPDQMVVTLRGGSPGSDGQPVTISRTDALALAAAFDGLLVSSATAAVDSQTFVAEFSLPLPDEYQVTRAVIAAGSVTVALDNHLPLACDVDLDWPQVCDRNGLPLHHTYALGAGGTANAALDFAGCTIQADAAPLSALAATATITMAGSAGLPVTLRATDSLGAALANGTISFSSVTGVVPAFTVPLQPLTETIDLPDEMNGLALTAASLQLTLTNAAGIPADLDLTLTGTSGSGTVSSLTVAERILPALGRATATTTIVLDETNSGILDFLNNLPRTITLGGSIIAGGGETGTVHADDYAVVTWLITAPVEVVISGATLDSDPAVLDLDADLGDRINTHAKGAVLRTEISNHLPLAVQLRVVADTDTSRLLTDPLLVVGPVTVLAAEIDPVTHMVSRAVTSNPTVTLTGEQARLLGLPGITTRVEAILPSTGGQPVRIMSTDYLEFRGVVELEVLIDDEL